MKTKRGIYHNLSESEYVASNAEVTFFFSSKLYLGKFLDGYKQHRKDFRERIARTMWVNEMNTDVLADIHLYENVEKRGFKAIVKGVNVNWQNLQKYAFDQMIEKNTKDWQEMQKPK